MIPLFLLSDLICISIPLDDAKSLDVLLQKKQSIINDPGAVKNAS